MGTFNEDYPEFRRVDSGNGSVDRIVQSYAAKDAARARNARMRMQAPAEPDIYQDGRRRDWEAQRALRDARQRRNANREVIDGRGSIDSRTFNESHQISAYSRDERDRHDPMVDTVEARTTWRSRAGQGFDGAVDPAGAHAMPAPLRPRGSRASDVGFSGVMSGRANYSAPASGPLAALPTFLKVTIPVIVILLAVIIYLVVF